GQPGAALADDRQRPPAGRGHAREIGDPDGVPIHGALVVRRQRGRGDERRRQHAPGRRRERDPLGADPPRVGEELRDGFVEGEHRGLLAPPRRMVLGSPRRWESSVFFARSSSPPAWLPAPRPWATSASSRPTAPFAATGFATTRSPTG